MKEKHTQATLMGNTQLKEARMPPPQRKKKPAPARDMMSIYPPRVVGATLGGYRSYPLTQAVRCWAKLMERATEEVARLFNAGCWNFLALAARGKEKEFDPEWANPGDHLAQLVEHAVRYEIELDMVGGKESAQRLADRLRKMEYLHAWAVIWALQCRADSLDHVRPADAWWTLAYRQGRFA